MRPAAVMLTAAGCERALLRGAPDVSGRCSVERPFSAPGATMWGRWGYLTDPLMTPEMTQRWAKM